MDTFSLRDRPVVRVSNVILGILLEESVAGYSVLEMAPDGSLVHRFYRRRNEALKMDIKVERLHSTYTGRVGLLRAAMEWSRSRRDVLRDVRLEDFSLGDDSAVAEIVHVAVECGHTWSIGVPAACAIRDPDIARRLVEEGTRLPFAIHVACLPSLNDGLRRFVLARAHAKHWPKVSEGGGFEDDGYGERLSAIKVTAAAYVFARIADIPIDDDEGIAVIRRTAPIDLPIPWVWNPKSL